MTSPTTGAGRASGRAALDPDAADLVAAAVLACPGVVGLHGGHGGRQVATYLPGRRVAGVRVDEDRMQVSVVAAAGVRLPAVAATVRASLAGLAGRRPVDVHIADVALPERQAVTPADPPGSP